MEVLVQFDINSCVCSSAFTNKSLESIRSLVLSKLTLTEEFYFLKSNGLIVQNENEIGNIIEVVPRLRGGKGGFGSMLRAIGAQIEKTTNREACRDLSGRRLRDINEEKRLKKWISMQSEREREKQERKTRKLNKILKQTEEKPHVFNDPDYVEQRTTIIETIYDSVEQGLASTSNKRKSTEEPKPIKKKKLIMDFDELTSSSDESENSEQQENSSSAAWSITSQQGSEASQDVSITLDDAQQEENSSDDSSKKFKNDEKNDSEHESQEST